LHEDPMCFSRATSQTARKCSRSVRRIFMRKLRSTSKS